MRTLLLASSLLVLAIVACGNDDAPTATAIPSLAPSALRAPKLSELPTPVIPSPTPEVLADPGGPCPVTIPDGSKPPLDVRPASGVLPEDAPVNYGRDRMWVSLSPDGRVVKQSQSNVVDANPLMWTVFWWLGEPGELKIDGLRLSGPKLANPSAQFRGEVSAGLGNAGIQMTRIHFPGEGCWEITGSAGDAKLTFVTLVDYISGDEPLPPTPTSTPAPTPTPYAYIDGPCPVTIPDGSKPPRGSPSDAGMSSDSVYNLVNYGNGTLWATLSPDGISRRGNSLMRSFWWRSARGRVIIEGRRLDGPAQAFQDNVSTGIGFFMTGLEFTSEGCWEVTATLGGSKLTFVTLVVVEERK